MAWHAPAADWVEHALDTGGAPYLHTPDEELPWLVAHSADVLIFTLGVMAAAGAALLFCMRAALPRLRPTVHGKVKRI